MILENYAEVKTNTASQVTYQVVNKVFGDIAQEAQNNYISEQETVPYVLIIDEINRAPLASVLGELIYGLEYRGKAFSTPYTLGKGTNQLIVPPNLFLIGTMNTADRSIGSMDYAVRRRFAFLSLPSEPQVIIDSWTKSKIKEVQDFRKDICEDITPFTEKQKTYGVLYADVRALFTPNHMATHLLT